MDEAIDEPWPRRILERLDGAARAFGVELAAAWVELAARLRLLDPTPPGYFTHPLALPTLELPRWAGALAARRGRPVAAPRLEEAAEAAAAGYLHVRLHDDFIDEGRGDPAVVMLLAEALLVHHQALMAALLPSGSAFWGQQRATWLAYHEAMLRERRGHRDGVDDAAAFAAVLGRSRPLALPPAAVLVHAGLDELVPDVAAIIEALARGHQLYLDLLHGERDLALGNRTWVLSRLASGGDRPALRRRLIAGGLDEIVDEAAADLERAAAGARGLGWDELGGWIAARRGQMEATRTAVYAELFGGLLGG